MCSAGVEARVAIARQGAAGALVILPHAGVRAVGSEVGDLVAAVAAVALAVPQGSIRNLPAAVVTPKQLPTLLHLLGARPRPWLVTAVPTLAFSVVEEAVARTVEALHYVVEEARKACGVASSGDFRALKQSHAVLDLEASTAEGEVVGA